MESGPKRRDASPHFLGAFYEGPINGRKWEGLRELGEDEYRRYVRDATTVLGFFSDYEQYETGPPRLRRVPAAPRALGGGTRRTPTHQ